MTVRIKYKKQTLRSVWIFKKRKDYSHIEDYTIRAEWRWLFLRRIESWNYRPFNPWHSISGSEPLRASFHSAKYFSRLAQEFGPKVVSAREISSGHSALAPLVGHNGRFTEATRSCQTEKIAAVSTGISLKALTMINRGAKPGASAQMLLLDTTCSSH